MVMRAQVVVALGVLGCVCVASLGAQGVGIRDVSASERSLIALNTKIRYTTMVILPEDEEILDVICGDRDFWVISATQNIAHLKPAKEGAATNLNLVTASGMVYSFVVSESKAAQPDLKVYVTADPTVTRAKPRYYSATQVSELERELTEARTAIDTVQHRHEKVIATFKRQYPSTLQFVYGAPKYEKPFLVRSIWHDGQFTYIKSDARELPTLYELKEGQPSLVNFQVEGGTYVVPKVLERGYLTVGNNRFAFQQGR
jgi:type IV secretion system protein VirB9